MSREVMIVEWCDVCLRNDDARTPSTGSSTISVDGNAFEIDLCDEHRIAIVGNLPDMLAKYGRKPEPTVDIGPRSSTEHVCPACGKRYTYGNNLAKHIAAQHGDGTPTAAARHVCDVCGFVAKATQGLGAHKRTKHGVVGTSDRANAERERRARDAATRVPFQQLDNVGLDSSPVGV